MRKLLLFLALLALLALAPQIAAAQTTVTGTITAAWASATYTISFQGQPGVQYSVNGAAVQCASQTPPCTGTLNGSGAITSIVLSDNNAIQPAGSQWRIEVVASAGTPKFFINFTATGATTSISSALQAAAPSLTTVPLEVNPKPGTGILREQTGGDVGLIVTGIGGQTKPLAIFAKSDGTAGVAILPGGILLPDGTLLTTANSPGGTVTATGSPASGNLTKFSGASSITNGDLSGDVTTSGTLAASVVKVNGAAVPTSAALLSSNGSNQLVAAAAPTAPITVSATGAIGGGGLGTVTGALKGNGSGVITQAACADLSNGAGGCSMSTTAGGDLSGTLPSPTVAKVNGAAVPTSAALLSSNGSNQLVAASAATAPVAVSATGAISITGAAGQVLAGSAPAFTAAPVLGVDGTTAGTVQLANSAAAFHNTLGSAATANNAINFFASVPTTGHLIDCTVASTTCTLHDSGVVTANVVNASSPGAGIARFAGSTQTVTSAELSGDATTSGSNAVTVVQVNGAAVPTSAKLVSTNASNQLVAAAASTSPITVGATGAIGCATCATTTNGGALSGTAPITVSAAGVIAGGGLGTVTGALRGNGSGVITQAACADLSNAASSCSAVPTLDVVGNLSATVTNTFTSTNTWTLASANTSGSGVTIQNTGASGSPTSLNVTNATNGTTPLALTASCASGAVAACIVAQFNAAQTSPTGDLLDLQLAGANKFTFSSAATPVMGIASGGSIRSTSATGNTTYQGGQDSASANTLGSGTFKGGDSSATSGTSGGGNSTLRGGNCTGASSGTCTSGDAVVVNGSNNATTETLGVTKIMESYPSVGTINAANDTLCVTGTSMQVTDCTTGPSINFVGIAQGTTAPVNVISYGWALVTTGAATAAVGNQVCLGTTTAGKATAQAGACTVGQGIGTVISITAVTSLGTATSTLPLVQIQRY